MAAVLVTVLLGAQPSAYGQRQLPRVPVSVSHSGDDPVGQRLAYEVREALRSSAGYMLTDRRDAYLYVSMVSLDPERDPSLRGTWAAVSIVYTMKNTNPFDENKPHTWYPIFLTSRVATVGRRVVEDQAKSIISALDEEYQEFRKESISK